MTTATPFGETYIAAKGILAKFVWYGPESLSNVPVLYTPWPRKLIDFSAPYTVVDFLRRYPRKIGEIK